MPDEPRSARRATTGSGSFSAEPAPPATALATQPAPPATALATQPAPPATALAIGQDWEARYKQLVTRAQEISRECDYFLSRLSKSNLSTADVHQALQRLARETKALQ